MHPKYSKQWECTGCPGRKPFINREAAEQHVRDYHHGQVVALRPRQTSKQLRAEIERLRNDLERLRSDRAYVVGWNDGFEHARKEGN